jgi:hypothetical protein
MTKFDDKTTPNLSPEFRNDSFDQIFNRLDLGDDPEEPVSPSDPSRYIERLDRHLVRLEGNLEHLERKLFAVQESRLFESLFPAFANVPINRVCMLAIFVSDQRDPDACIDPDDYVRPIAHFIPDVGFEALQSYTYLSGSSLYRFVYQTSKHQTLDQFQALQRQLAEELVSLLKENQIQNITINLYPPSQKSEPKEWAGKFKDVSEALKNLLLVGAGCTILLGGTLISSKRETPEKPPSVTVKQIAPKDQLELLPKILEANTPEDFDKATSEVPHAAAPKEKPKRKFR